MGGGSRAGGCGFESQHLIRDGHFSHGIVKILIFFEKGKIYFQNKSEIFRDIFSKYQPGGLSHGHIVVNIFGVQNFVDDPRI